MNKADIVAKLAQKTDSTLAQADKNLSALLGIIKDALQNGNTVAFVGFGNFSVKARAARTGSNPKTGEPLLIAAKKVVSFSAGKTLKDAVNR